jgi:tetratricopeptide (TPR) repeat protein
MSVTTVAGPVQPDHTRALLPASRPERFQRTDFIAAGLVFLITLTVYILTLSPSVTLEDSGELITGAAGFGVPHPPGYPLWTMSGFLFSHLIPFGNVAWRVNLESAVFGAAANAVLTLLVCHSGRWLAQRWTGEAMQPLARRLMFYIGMLAGLVIGFSDVMWSQGVIAEVYTLNGLFVNLVLLLFYFWMLEPQRLRRLLVAVFVFALGLTNHHTLIQMIPAMLAAAALIQWLPPILSVPPIARPGLFWSVLLAVSLFSLSILAYLSWLSADPTLHQISYTMAVGIFLVTAAVSFFYTREFRWRAFLTGAFLTALIFAYGHYFLSASDIDTARWVNPGAHFWLRGCYVHPGWMQITSVFGVLLLVQGVVAVGLLFNSILDRRLVLGVFVVGWVGLAPYGYESFASNTNPPMNWSVASIRSGFYYSVTRLQYPLSLPNLIKEKIGTAIGVVPSNAVHDVGLDNSDYWHRLWLTLYYYGDNLQDNFTVPLIFLTLAILVYITRCDWKQISWFLFLITAFFFLGFMLHLISPPQRFDFQSNLNYKVFNLQSHCIFVILLGYGALAALLYLNEVVPDIVARFGPGGLGVPALYLSLLPLWSNFDDGNQANHWFGYQFGHDVMQSMDRNAIYFGASDFGRFVPTYMAFEESQQPARWKHDPSFDRRDVAVITQVALCDPYYSQYIRQQYDARFRPKPQDYTPFEKWLGRSTAYPATPILCNSPAEFDEIWTEYKTRPEVVARVKSGEADARNGLRSGTMDVYEVNAIAAEKIFEKNKAAHTFYLEQTIPMTWTYPYMLPEGLIFKLSPTKLKALPPAAIAADYKFWNDYAARLEASPVFRVDDDATLTFGTLAYHHSDLYRWRDLPKDEENFLKLAVRLSPQLEEAVLRLNAVYMFQQRFDDALALMRQAAQDDPRSEVFPDILDEDQERKEAAGQEKKLRGQLATAPYDLALNLQLARTLQEEGKTSEVESRLRTAAALTNWDHDQMAGVVQYYVEDVHNVPAAVGFLKVRAGIEPKNSPLIYGLAALEASLGRTNDALGDLTAASKAPDGTNALMSAQVDARFAPIKSDPRFQALVNRTNLPAATTNAVPTTSPPPSTHLPAAKPTVPKGKRPAVPPARNAPPLVPISTNIAPAIAKKQPGAK